MGMSVRKSAAILKAFFSEIWKIRLDLFPAEYYGIARARYGFEK